MRIDFSNAWNCQSGTLRVNGTDSSVGVMSHVVLDEELRSERIVPLRGQLPGPQTVPNTALHTISAPKACAIYGKTRMDVSAFSKRHSNVCHSLWINSGRQAAVVFTWSSLALHRGFIFPCDPCCMKPPTLPRSLALCLQVVTMLIGICILGFLLWEPHVEGRNAHATVFEIYFKDPFLAYVYVGSIPFFVAVYRAFKLFNDVRRNETFSLLTLNDLRAINRCAITLVGFIAGGVVFILIFGDGEDRPAGIFMSALFASGASVIAIAASKFAHYLQTALMKSGSAAT